MATNRGAASIRINMLLTISLVLVYSDNLNEHFGHCLTGGMI